MRKAVPIALACIVAGSLVAAWGVAQNLPGAAASDAPPEDDASPGLTRVGDVIRFHMRIFDQHGRMLYSTRAADRSELEAVKSAFDGPFLLPVSKNDAPQRHTVTDGLRPIPFDDNATIPVGGALLGKPVGHVAAFPFVGRMAGYNQSIELERTRGPFNLTMSLRTETLDNLTGTPGADRVVLDDLIEADVLERGDAISRIRLDVQDGQRLVVRRAGLVATASVDQAAGQFYLRLDAEVGHAFSLSEGCAFARYVLALGSYLVTAVDDQMIRLAASPTKWPQLMDRELVMVLEITDIQRTEVKNE